MPLMPLMPLVIPELAQVQIEPPLKLEKLRSPLKAVRTQESMLRMPLCPIQLPTSVSPLAMPLQSNRGRQHAH